jgi:hypothetical protein
MRTVAQPGIAADRFAHEIVAILTVVLARSQQLNAKPLGGPGNACANPNLLYRFLLARFKMKRFTFI